MRLQDLTPGFVKTAYDISGIRPVPCSWAKYTFGNRCGCALTAVASVYIEGAFEEIKELAYGGGVEEWLIEKLFPSNTEEEIMLFISGFDGNETLPEDKGFFNDLGRACREAMFGEGY